MKVSLKLLTVALWLLYIFGVCFAEEGDAPEGEAPEETGSSEEGGEDTPKLATCMLVIITILLILSSLFDFIKETLIEKTAENMRRVVGVLFEELTVLGFLSLTTFVLTKMDILQEISQVIFGEQEELIELLENVHYDLFLVMVIFIIQTVMLVRLGESTSEEWKEMDKKLADFEEVERSRNFIKEQAETAGNCFDWTTAQRLAKTYELFEHGCLKKEFLRGRRVIPPFDHFPIEEHLVKEFDYAQYLNLNLAKFISKIVEMNVKSWIFLEFWLVAFYGIMFAAEFNSKALIIIWLALGYLLMVTMLLLKAEARRRLEMHLNPIDMPSKQNGYQADSMVLFHPTRAQLKVTEVLAAFGRTSEDTPMLHTAKDVKKLEPWRNKSHRTMQKLRTKAKEIKAQEINYNLLPGWCALDVESEDKRPFWKKYICGVGANRQMMLYFFEVNGPANDTMILRVVLFMHAIYVSILFLRFSQSALEEFGRGGLAAVLIVGLIPSFSLILLVVETIKNTVHTNGIGCLKNKKYIAQVIRNMKVRKAVNALILMRNLTAKFDSNGDVARSSALVEIENAWKSSQDSAQALEKLSEKLGRVEFEEICAMFDMFDHDKGGAIDIKELGALMKSIGKLMDDNELEQTMKRLDSSGDGSVDKVEFLLWHAAQMESKHKPMSPKEMATQLFKLFDKDGSGELSITELKEEMDKLDVGLSTEDIGDLIKELDEDGDNKISAKEFQELLEKYASVFDES